VLLTWRCSSLLAPPSTSSALCRLERDGTTLRSHISENYMHAYSWYIDRPCPPCIENKTTQILCDHLIAALLFITGQARRIIAPMFVSFLTVGGSCDTSNGNPQASPRRRKDTCIGCHIIMAHSNSPQVRSQHSRMMGCVHKVLTTRKSEDNRS